MSWIRLKEALVADPQVLRDPACLADWTSGAWRLSCLTEWLQSRTVAEPEKAACQWRLLEEGFGRAVAEAYREGLMNLWRITTPERPIHQQGGGITEKRIIVLAVAGLAVEAAEDPGWASRLSSSEATRAVQHARMAEREYPDWFEDLVARHPAIALPVFREMLIDEWTGRHPGRADALWRYGRSDRALPTVLAHPLSDVVTGELPSDIGTMRRGLWVLARLALDEDERNRVRVLARTRLEAERASTEDGWGICNLALLFHADVDAAVGTLTLMLDEPQPCSASTVPASISVCQEDVASDEDERQRPVTSAERTLSALFGREDELRCGQALANASVGALEELVRLAYRHVRPADDLIREGAYTPGPRDEAQNARNTLLGALLDRPGADAYRAMRRLAEEPVFADRKQRFHELAHGKAERDAELPSWAPRDVVAFEMSNAAPAKTGDALLRVVMGVLADVGAALIGRGADASSRPLLQRALNEEEVQHWLAEQMSLRAKGRFHIYREVQVALGDKPDLVVASTAAPVEVAIEVKHGGMGWSIRDLEGALVSQLAEDYLKPANRRHGVLVVSYHGRRAWRAPDNGATLSFEEVIERLQKLAITKVTNLSGAIEVRGVGLNASGEGSPIPSPRRKAPETATKKRPTHQ